MFGPVKVRTALELTTAIILWTVVFAKPFRSSTERRTSRSYFARCGRGSSSNLERLSSAVPIRKLLASFDINKNVAFFRLESCSSYKICFITKTNVISRKDFGAPNTVLWSKLVKEYQGKKPEPFSEIKHRRMFARSKLEDSCLHGFYVIGQGTRDGAMQSDGSPESILTQGEDNRKKRRKKKRKPRRNNAKRNRHRRRKQGNRKRSAYGCQTDEEFCVRRCIAWNNGDCVRLQISCSFLCPSGLGR